MSSQGPGVLPPGRSTPDTASLDDLRQAVQRYDSLIAAVPTMVYHANPSGVPTWFSSSFYEYTGITPDTLTNWRKVAELVVHPDDVSRIGGPQLQAVKQGVPFEAEIRLRSRTGEYRWHLNRAVPVRNQAGEVVEWVGTTTDIHERRVMEDDLRRSNQMKDEFVGFVSHELRSPLTSIYGSARLLQARADRLNDHEKQELLATVVDESERLKEIIEELLTIARTELSGEIEKTAVDVRDVVQSLADDLKLSGRRIDLDCDESTVLAEPVMLRQVLANLISNAHKYSPPESPIDVSVARRQGAYVVEVGDRGPGVPAEDLDRIFEPFFRSPESARGAKGSGLGLAVSRRLVEAQGGSVSALLRPGGGLLVRIELPLDGAAPRAAC
ncbi:MAG TPA: PAS domain-containing sensor histidine kinase [Dehalococcoidia bacterium]|nr:PAS domain-containing sensor histidine kinase [Dehalococcoidia bacterium]